MIKPMIVVTCLLLIVASLIFHPSLAKSKKQPEAKSSPGMNTSAVKRPADKPLAKAHRDGAQAIQSSSEDLAQSGVALPQRAVGPVYSQIPKLTPDQTRIQESAASRVNLPVPVAQGEQNSLLPSSVSPPTQPAPEQTWLSKSDSNIKPDAANDFTYKTIHDLTPSEASSSRSVIDEPSTANMGSTIFYTGNWYAARSTDGGQSFTYVNPSTTFPSVNGGFCCDQIANFAPSQNMALWELLYSHDSTSGTIRIARAVGSSAVANNTWIYYDFNPQKLGFPTNTWLDFPNMTVSDNYLYVTANVFDTVNGCPQCNFIGSVIWRIHLSELAAGGTVNYEYLKQTDVGALRCAEGVHTTMYWGALLSTSQVRIYRWDDSGTSIFHDDVNVSSFAYMSDDGVATSPDGTNWAARADSRILGAWVANGVIGLMWPAKQGGSFPYPYIIIARFNQSDRTLISQNQLWNSQNAWLYPTVSVNSAGNLAGLAAYGGGSYYPGTNVWISDDVQNGFNPLALYGAASSNIGPSSNAWGDYLTVRPHKDSPNTWVASTYYLKDSGSNVVPRYLWFGRERDFSASATNYEGYVDVMNCSTISGWAADRNRLNTSINVSIYDGTTLIATVLANGSRPDVGSYLGDNGLHGFSITTPASLKNGQSHSISVKFESSSTNLTGSPNSITCSTSTGTWNQLTSSVPGAMTNCLLMTDGRVMCQQVSTNQWYALTPNSSGSYVNGTWTTLASMPSNYKPLYYASAVLPDGRVIVEGGEYNAAVNTTDGVWTNLGAIYDPISNVWTAVTPPSGWSFIGDASGIVLADGTFLLSDSTSKNMAKLNATTLTWTAFGSGYQGTTNDESGWVLLPDTSILTVDASPLDSLLSERLNTSTGVWSSAGNTSVSLADNSSARVGDCRNCPSHEIGPGVLRPNGTVFWVGANPNIGTACCSGSAHTAIFNTATGTWSAGPNIPNSDAGNDAPAAVLPSGSVLMQLAPPANPTSTFGSPSRFYEFDGSTIFQVNSPTDANYPSYYGGMLVLPTGQVLFTHQSTDIEVYTPTGSPNSSWAPTITSVPSTLQKGGTYTISGTQFNGLTQGAYYGDDLQAATNYPLVRITNNATGHVFYARTHGHSSMGVATGSTPVSTSFDVPAGIETGASTLVVVANGIASSPSNVNITTGGGTVQVTVQTSPAGRTFTVDGTTYSVAQTFSWTTNSSHTIGTTSPQSGGTGTQYVWSSWNDGGAISHTVSPGSNTTYTANFTTQYFLTMSAGANGTVSPSSGYFNSGQSVNISATPNSNFVFNGWTGSGTGSYSGTNNPATVTVNGPITETGSFSNQLYTIAVSASPTAGGTVSGGGTFAAGSSRTVTATANSGYTFTNWTENGSVVSTSASYTFTLNGNRNLVANFTVINYTIAVSASPTAGGSVTGGGTFAAGSSRTVTATANSGYTFANWTENGSVVSTSASYSFTLNSNRNLVANFTANISVTVQTNPSGLSYTVDGSTFTAASTFTWTAGSTHTIATTSPQTGANGTQYVWSSWSDVGALQHTVAPTSNATYTATFASQPPTVQLSAAIYSVGESAGSISLTVNRAGDTSTAVTVNYATSDTAGLAACNQFNGVASSRCDYATTVGTLQFAAGETSKTIFIPIVNDSYAEGNESFTIGLSNPSGATLGSNSTAKITIIDDDTTTGGNPVVGVPFFVRQQYIDFLGREPDPAGFSGWQSILNNCPQSGKDAQGNFCDRIEVSADFFRSPEFQDRGYFVFRFYPVALGRNPSYVEFMPDLAKVSGFLSDAQLEANKVAFVQEFMSRTEFTNRYGSLTTAAAYIDALLQTCGLPNHPSRTTWINALTNQTMTRAQVLRALAESAEVYQKFYNQSFVVMQYFGYLRRDPDILYLQWIDTMNKNGGDYRVMINGFMNSTEYFLRFGP